MTSTIWVATPDEVTVHTGPRRSVMIMLNPNVPTVSKVIPLLPLDRPRIFLNSFTFDPFGEIWKIFCLTTTYTLPAGNPPIPLETAIYGSMDVPVVGSVAKRVTLPELSMAFTVFLWACVTSRALAVAATPTGFPSVAKVDGPVALSPAEVGGWVTAAACWAITSEISSAGRHRSPRGRRMRMAILRGVGLRAAFGGSDTGVTRVPRACPRVAGPFFAGNIWLARAIANAYGGLSFSPGCPAFGHVVQINVDHIIRGTVRPDHPAVQVDDSAAQTLHVGKH